MARLGFSIRAGDCGHAGIRPPRVFSPAGSRLQAFDVLSECQTRPARVAYLRAEGQAVANTRVLRAVAGATCQRKAAFAGQMHAVGEGRAQGKAGRVSHCAFRFSFCFFTGGCFSASNMKTCGRKQGKIPIFGSSFSGMRTKIRRHADNCTARCGEKKCVLRQAARALAESKR